MSRVAVCSKSFSKNETLRKELLKIFPDSKFNDQGVSFSPSQLVDFLKDTELAIIGLEKIDAEVLSKLPKLKIIGKYGVGTDAIDFAALKKYEIQFGWTAGVNKRSVAELAIGHMLACLRHLYTLNTEVKSGEWQTQKGRELGHQCVGIIGFGNVGQDLAKLLNTFGAEVIAHDIAERNAAAKELSVEMCSVDELLRRSDIVSIHTPLDASTRNFINSDRIAQMKTGAILINTARGNIVDENALRLALLSGHLQSAAFDVLAEEPPTDLSLIHLANFFISPHIGGSSQEAILAMGRAAIQGLENPKAL